MLEHIEIRSPRGIRFDCSGCSNCCLQWPVPLTAEDYERISRLPHLSSSGDFSSRALKSTRQNLSKFSHTLEKQADGRCEFLLEDKRCRLHAEHGHEAKPAMCRLFPYSFTVTPDAVLTSLSFASTAVLFNTGRLLSEQSETLQAQYALFRSLFSTESKPWHQLQLVDGEALSWEKFRAIDQEIDSIIYGDEVDAGQVPDKMGKKLRLISAIARKELKDPSLAEREPRMESRPKVVDQILLKHLERLYFPLHVFAEDNYDLNAREMLTEMVSAPQTVSFGQDREQLKFSELINTKLGSLPQEVEELINRFLYVRLFSKLFFGPGFHHLSLLAGLHHLSVLHLLLRLKLKQVLLLNPGHPANFEQACELLRTLERRLTQLDLSAQSLAMLEVMLSSPLRQERLPFLAE